MRTASGCDGERGRDRSSKRDDMGAGALDQCLAHGGSAGEKVHDSQRQESKMLHEFQRAEATSFNGLHNRHISRGKGSRERPGHQQDREIVEDDMHPDAISRVAWILKRAGLNWLRNLAGVTARDSNMVAENRSEVGQLTDG